TTLAALGFAPSTADPSLFLRTDATLPPFYVLMYVDDLVFATADTEALAHMKSELQKRHTCTDLAPPSDESVEPSGPTSGMGLVLGGRARVVLTGHADASWVDDLATQRSSQGYTFSLGSDSVTWRSTRSSSVLSSSCEAEIYAGAMAAQELRWLTYLMTDLGEAPRSPPFLYVDNKAMLALCQEHRLEHRTKHIALRYFLARELQQCGQLRLAYVVSQANTADFFTKAFQPCLHLPSLSTNLVSTAALQDAVVTTTIPGGHRVSICTCTRTGRHLATFTRRPGSSLYTLAIEPSQVAASAQVSASGQVAASCSCRLLSHQTLLWHHRLGHPSLPRLRGMHSHLLVSSLPRSLPSLPPSPAPPSLLLVSPDDCSPADSPHGLRLQLCERFGQDLFVLRLHSDKGGEFSSNLLQDFCRGEGILQSFTLLESPQQNGIAECRIGSVMEVARTSMIHATAPHFLWPFAVWYAAHQLNLWPHVSLPETLPTLRWTGEVGDASVFRVWGSRAFVRDTSADELSPRAIPCGLAPSGVSQVDPLFGPARVQVAIDSGAARGTASVGAEPGGAECEGGETGGAEPGVSEVHW
ncbi:unnamed protein product, partial [Closterium sp. NIES-54]